MTTVLMPVCEECGDKFPGDPCKGCGHSPKLLADIAAAEAAFADPDLLALFSEAERRSVAFAAAERERERRATRHLRMPSATRRRRRHGRR